uniref:RRM domain-containing protein n=1 Tax=Panagrolaimus superbus TaxID=310955 RepID=A0A914ZCS6_9BILA
MITKVSFILSTGGRLFVGGIPYDWSISTLRDIFSKYGNILDIHLKHGYAFVEYDLFHDAEDAIYKTDGGRKFGRRVTVEFAKRRTLDENDRKRHTTYRKSDYSPPRRQRSRSYTPKDRYKRKYSHRERSPIRSPVRRERTRSRSHDDRHKRKRSYRERSPSYSPVRLQAILRFAV